MKRIFFLLLIVQQNILSMIDDAPQETWNIKKQLQHTKPIKSAKYNPQGNQIYILDYDGNKVTLINVDNEEHIALPHYFGLWKPSFDPSGRYIVTGPNEKTIALSSANGKVVTSIIPKGYPEIVRFDHQGNQILIATDKNVELRNLDGTVIISNNLESDYRVKIAQFFPHNDDLIFLAPYAKSMSDPKTKIWDVRNKNLIVYDYIPVLKQASLHADGSYIVCTKQEGGGVAYFYDLRKKGNAILSNFNKPRSAKFNSTGTHIVTQYNSAYLALLWETQSTIKCIDTRNYPKFSVKFNPTNLSSATFNPAGDHILTRSIKNIFSNENNMSIWDLEGNQLAKLPHNEKIYSAKYDPTGNYIITSHENNIVTLWENSK